MQYNWIQGYTNIDGLQSACSAMFFCRIMTFLFLANMLQYPSSKVVLDLRSLIHMSTCTFALVFGPRTSERGCYPKLRLKRNCKKG